MLQNFGAQSRKSRVRPAPSAMERKDFFTLITMLAGAAVVTEWVTGNGNGGWISRAIEWLTDEQVRVENRISALEDQLDTVEEGSAAYYDISHEITRLEERLAEIEAANNDASSQ